MREGSFRESVQSLVRNTVRRGGSASEVAALLRATYGRAYRRTDLLADIRRYRAPVPRSPFAFPADPHRLLARAGVAVFVLSLLLPTLVSRAAGDGARVLVADTTSSPAPVVLALATERISTLEERAALRAILATPTPAPTVVPTPAPTIAPPVTYAGGPAIRVIASWYGPGFYENRLPCWPWLQANGLPIQFLPDTWGVAHKTLPCGTTLRLTYGANTVTVPVVDRGPYIPGRELDLSPRVKAALGCPDLCSLLMQIP